MPVSLTTILDEIDPRRREALIEDARRLPSEDAALQSVLDDEAAAGQTDDKNFAFVVYADTGGRFRLQFRSQTGQIVLSSSESYASKADALDAVGLLQDFGRTAEVVA